MVLSSGRGKRRTQLCQSGSYKAVVSARIPEYFEQVVLRGGDLTDDGAGNRRNDQPPEHIWATPCQQGVWEGC